MDRAPVFHETLRVMRRRAGLLFLVTLVGSAIAVAAAFMLPERYEAKARVLVQSAQIADALVRPTVGYSARERLRLIEQRLMSRGQLSALIDRLGIFSDRPDISPLEKVETLRQVSSIEIDRLSIGSEWEKDPAVMVFTFSVILPDPEEAAKVANEFASVVVGQNVTGRAELARETVSFFDAEAERLAAELEALDEQRLEARRLRRAPATGAAEGEAAGDVDAGSLASRQTLVREQYAATLRKRAEAEVGARLESGQQAERFEVLEKALVPPVPVSPNKTKIIALGVGLSGMAALALAWFLEMLNPAIRTSAQMQRRLNLTPVVSIPYVRTAAERRRTMLAGWSISLLLLAALSSALWLFDRKLMPIEDLIANVSPSVSGE